MYLKNSYLRSLRERYFCNIAQSFEHRRHETIRPVIVARVQLDADTFVQLSSREVSEARYDVQRRIGSLARRMRRSRARLLPFARVHRIIHRGKRDGVASRSARGYTLRQLQFTIWI